MPADLVLALDSATPVLSAALLRRGPGTLTLLGTRAFAPPTVSSTTVPGCFDDLLNDAGATLDDVAILVAGSGPGLFTGLRTTLATMKAIAYARGLPLVGGGSLEALSHAVARGPVVTPGDVVRDDEAPTTGLVATVLDARKGELYAAVHRWNAGTLEVVVAPNAPTPDVFATTLAGFGQAVTVVGTGAKALAGRSDRLEFPAIPTHPTAAQVAAVALRNSPAPVFDRDAVLTFEPFYLRPPEAEVARQKRIAAGEKIL